MGITICNNPDGTITIGCGGSSGGVTPAPSPGTPTGGRGSPIDWGEPADLHAALTGDTSGHRLVRLPLARVFGGDNSTDLEKAILEAVVGAAVIDSSSGKLQSTQPMVIAMLPGQSLNLASLQTALRSKFKSPPLIVIKIADDKKEDGRA